MKRSEIRQHIIETASYLFYKNGYNLTGINEIIAEAVIAKATLYNHFKSKEDICLAYLQFRNTTFLEEIKRFCFSKPKGQEQVLALFDFLQLFFKDKDFNGCWCIKTVAEIPREEERIRKEIKGQKEAFLGLIGKILAANVELEAGMQDTVARKVYLLYESAVAESHLHQEDWPISSARQLTEMII